MTDGSSHESGSSGPEEGTPLGTSYRIFELIGRGGMGEVHRGASATAGPVAVKLLRPDLAADPAMVARFLQERGILTTLSHPNIVRILDLVAEGQTLAIVMELVDGHDLRTELAERGTLPAAQAAALTAGVLRGLAAVHGVGVVHRDLKPENVLLQRAPDGGVIPKITDFGISTLMSGSTRSRHTSVIGTPYYMAPELINESDPSVASDLYSVGIMLYEVLCGVTPFTGKNPLAVLAKHTQLAPGRPDGVPDSLWGIITELLAKAPEQRPASAALVATALESLLPGLAQVPALTPLTEPPAADPDGATVLNTLVPQTVPQEVGPPKRSRRKLVAAILAAVVVLAGGGTAAALALRSHGSPSAGPSGGSTPSVTSPTTAGTPTPTTTSPTSDTASTSVNPDAAAAIVPKLVGLTLGDAEAQLSALGVPYSTKDVLDDSNADGTVVAQTPAPGKPAGTGVVLSVARAASVTYLEDLGTVGQGPSVGPIQMSKTTYSHSIYTSGGQYGDCGDLNTTWEYDLGEGFTTLEGTAGLGNDSDSNQSVLVEIYKDANHKVWSGTVSLGHRKGFVVDVTGTLRLTITTTALGDCNSTVESTLALGNVRLLSPPDLTTTTPTS